MEYSQGEVGKLIAGLSEQHVAIFNKEEKPALDKARKYFNGEFKGEDAGKEEGIASYKCTKNLVYAAADTAISALLGSNPTVSANGVTPESEAMQDQATALISGSLRNNNIRRKDKTAILDGMLGGRAVFKQVWDHENDCEIISVPRLESVFFDLEVRDPKDIRYWLQCVPMPKNEFMNKMGIPVESGGYSNVDLETGRKFDVVADGIPSWMDRLNHSEKSGIRDLQKWVTVWEYYDMKTMTAYHWFPAGQALILKGKFGYRPYSLFEMNPNGEDCRGQSEVKLILPQQDTINDMLTHWKHIVYLLIPRILYNAGVIDAEELNKAIASSVGAFVPVTPRTGGAALVDLATCFKDMPLPTIPPEVPGFLDRQENDAGYVSAVSEMARGRQIPPGTTATAVAVMDQQSRSRIGTREGNLAEVMEEVAKTSFYLHQRFMKRPRYLDVAGGKKLKVFGHQFQDLDFLWEMSAYNPIKNNPMVLVELLKGMLPLMQESGNYDMRRVWKFINRLSGIPADLMISEDEIAKQAQEAQAMAAAQAAPPTPPMPEAPLPVEPNPADAEQQIPPSVMASLQNQGLPSPGVA